MKKIGIVGCGNLGASIVEGIHDVYPDYQLYASKRDLSSLPENLFEKAVITDNNALLLEKSDLIILALKPYTILSFLEEIAADLDPSRHTLISVATGVQISEIAAIIPEGVGIYRAMPNTAISVTESMTAISRGNDPLNREMEITELFNALGEVVFIEENLMESATILGACGVAYVLRFMRAMIQGGIEVGFDAATATKIVSQTMKGASELIIQNNSHPEAEIDKVTTPKGCTIVGLNEMEHAGFSSALIKGIVTSYKKIER
ncbi:MAG: pyrroline-5-carboxylate reductase [Crocinitomicaceae bacterium]|jgi:pyrroline-5-carboxylate reductase